MPKEYWDKPKPRTKAKLELLRHYLGAWFEILARATNANGDHLFDEIAYLDGFCGRGEYADGEQGSPLIAVRFANSVAAKRGDLTISVILVDKIKKNIDHLKTLDPIRKPHPNVKIHAIHGSFDDTVLGIFDRLSVPSSAPTFSFVDPYGLIKDPNKTFERLVRNQSSELFINFMEGYVNRFLNHRSEKTRDTFISAIGKKSAERVLAAADGIAAISNEYTNILRSFGQYVRTFQMRDEKNVRDNTFFFCGNNRQGFKKIKEAMWKIDPVNGSEFSAYTFVQQKLQGNMLEGEPDRHGLKIEVLQQYSGCKNVAIKDLKFWVDFKSERFLYKHLRYVLEDLVAVGTVVYQPPTSRKRAKNTWPQGSLFSFVTIKFDGES